LPQNTDVSAFFGRRIAAGWTARNTAVAGKELRVSVPPRTTSTQMILDRKRTCLMARDGDVAKRTVADQVLLFVVDILKRAKATPAWYTTIWSRHWPKPSFVFKVHSETLWSGCPV